MHICMHVCTCICIMCVYGKVTLLTLLDLTATSVTIDYNYFGYLVHESLTRPNKIK